MIELDPLTLGLLAVVLGFFLFMYLMVRRALIGFKEGFRGSKEK